MENAKCYAPQILVGTEGLPREQWLEYRRKGIGGSDAAAVLGISPFRTGRDLYYDKLNIVTADDAENWVQLEVGTLLEPLVAKIFAYKTGYKIYRRPFMFQHPLYPWMLADLDYMVELPDGTTAILEIKTTNYNAKDNWWYNGEEIVPIYYESQGRHYMAVMNIDRVYFCCLYGNSEDEAIIRRIDRDMAYEEELIALERDFWENHVLTKTPPPYVEADGDLILESLRRKLGPADKDAPPVLLGQTQFGQLSMLLSLQEQKKTLSADVNKLEKDIKRLKGKAESQEETAGIIRELYREQIAAQGIEQVEILSPFRSEGEASVNSLNVAIREEINPAAPQTPEIVYAGKIFRLNDRVMQMRNNYDIKLYDRSGKQVGEGVFNGDIGTIRKISGTNVVIEFDGRYMDCPQVLLDDLELSYAITIHKSMGSEYDTVIIPLLAAHNVLLTRNLLYTAITRAKRRVLLVGEKRALYMAIHRSRKGKRNTMLGERIALYYKAVTRKALRNEEGEEWQRAS